MGTPEAAPDVPSQMTVPRSRDGKTGSSNRSKKDGKSASRIAEVGKEKSKTQIQSEPRAKDKVSL